MVKKQMSAKLTGGALRKHQTQPQLPTIDQGEGEEERIFFHREGSRAVNADAEINELRNALLTDPGFNEDFAPSGGSMA